MPFMVVTGIMQFLPKNTQISNFLEICPVGDEFFLPDGQKGRNDETNGRLSQFCENCILIEKCNYFKPNN
jgi:hypothetical protein